MGGEMRKTTDWQDGRRKRPLKVKGFRGAATALVLPSLVVLLVALLATCDIHSQFTDTIQKKVDEDLGVVGGNGGDETEDEDAVVTITEIPGVTPPAAGETPVTEITETDQYTGTVSWSPADNPFAYATEYTATITLSAKAGYTLTGVAADFFTVAGAISVSNDADSGVVTAVFPATGDTPPEVIDIAAIPGVTAPASGESPVTEITETDQYTGTVSWSPDDDSFAAETIYTATITLTAKGGYTLSGVTENFFTVDGANSVTHGADSGVVTAVFPATGRPVLIYDANGGTAGTVPANVTEYYSGNVVTVLGNTGNLVGVEFIGEHTGSGIKQRFIGWNTDSSATTAQYNAGDEVTIVENTTLYAVYTTGTDVLGKVGPAGGWVFYDAGSIESWGRYLEAAPASTEWGSKGYGDYHGEEAIGGDAALTGIGDGQAATDAIVLHMEGKEITGTAAQLCDALEHEHEGTTYKDWFLPSKYELGAIYDNIVDDSSGSNSGVGGFAPEDYWSSSEDSSHSAWKRSFDNGYWGDPGAKRNLRRVRAVRAF